MNKPANVTYANERLIDDYLLQGAFHESPVAKYSYEASLEIPLGPLSLKVNRESDTRSKIGLLSKFYELESYLKRSNDLSYERPQETPDVRSQCPSFVLEKTAAVRVVIPCPKLKEHGRPNMAVWISDPDATRHASEPYIWRGTFLFLVEDHHDPDETRFILSGCSALKFVVNLIEDEPSLTPSSKREDFGRDCSLHPIEKLKRIGGISSEERPIETLYRIRYMTNEQSYRFAGEKRRVNDLVGYPLFIKT